MRPAFVWIAKVFESGRMLFNVSKTLTIQAFAPRGTTLRCCISSTGLVVKLRVTSEVDTGFRPLTGLRTNARDSLTFSLQQVQFFRILGLKKIGTMSEITFGKEFSAEIESEVRASRKCLEVIPDRVYKYKPHEKSMEMGYLALLVADIPKWIAYMVERREIDLATYERFPLSTPDALIKYFDENIEAAKRALDKVTNKELDGTFELKVAGKVVMTSTKKESIQQAINHWVHHRGQLTVYMRLNDIPVPSIYGPSADDRTF